MVLLGLAGIPIADLAFYAVMMVVCSLIVRSKVGSYGNRGIAVVFVKTAIAGLIGAVVAAALANGLSLALSNITLNAVVEAVIILAISGCIGLVVSFGLCHVLRVEEFSVLARIGNKLFGRFLPKKSKGKHARRR